MGFIWLTELKNEQEKEVCVNLDQIIRIEKKQKIDNCFCYRIYWGSLESDSILVIDKNNHLANTLFKNKAKE